MMADSSLHTAFPKKDVEQAETPEYAFGLQKYFYSVVAA